MRGRRARPGRRVPLGFGVVCVTVGGLRLLQEETGSTFTGNWSWAPYVIMTVVLGRRRGAHLEARDAQEAPGGRRRYDHVPPTPPLTSDPPPITKADIEAKLQTLKGGVDTEIANVKGIAIAVGVTVAVVVVLATFALGRRRGRKLATIVEIRRV